MAKNVKLTVDGQSEAPAPSTPTESMSVDANKTVTVQDGQGRTIALKKPGIVQYFRMLKMVGDYPQRYINMAYPLLFIISIDGDPVGFPNSEAEIDALIVRLGDDGVAAVLVGVAENWGAKEDDEAVMTAVKK